MPASNERKMLSSDEALKELNMTKILTNKLPQHIRMSHSLSSFKKDLGVLYKSHLINFDINNRCTWMNEWMKSYIAHVSSRRLFRALNIESNLARPVIIQIPTQSPGRYTAELPLRRIKLFSFQAYLPYVPSTHTLWIFWGLAGWKLRLRPLRFFYVQL